MSTKIRTIAVAFTLAAALGACTSTVPGARVAGPAVGSGDLGVMDATNACRAAEIGSGAPVRYFGLTTPFNDEPLSTCAG